MSIVKNFKKVAQLDCSKALTDKLRRQMGDKNFVRWLRNLGVPFDDAYTIMFDRPVSFVDVV